MNRRDFWKAGGSCAAHLWLVGAMLPVSTKRAFGRQGSGRVVKSAPWGNLEEITDGVWALISTPLAGGENAMRTLCNGGIVAGRSGVLIVEGFASNQGAQWIQEAALELTGRHVTHVVLTHYHGDHSGGLAGYLESGTSPDYLTTETTRDTLAEAAERRGRASPAVTALADAELLSPDGEHVIDLGGRKVTVTPRSGHTASDLQVTVDDPNVVFGGDLLWNGLFPNYRDAIPSQLSPAVRAMTDDRRATFVPGHGTIPTDRELGNYLGLLDTVEQAARRAHESGSTAAEAAAEFELPSSLGEWILFSDRYYEVALSAWERELSE